MILYRTKYFTTLTHYTTAPGTIQIMRNGFIDQRQEKLHGLSFFDVEDDYIRNNPKIDMVDLIKYYRSLNPKDKIYIKKLNEKDDYGYDLYDIGENAIVYRTNFGYLKTKNQYNSDPVLDASEHYNSFIRHPENKNPLPIELSQLQHLSGAIHHNKNNDRIYRIITKSKNNRDLYSIRGMLETRTPAVNIDNTKNKLEIPRGMYKAHKDGYLNDFSLFKESDYNMNDLPTREAVVDMLKNSRK
jgi:hypothetical protein